MLKVIHIHTDLKFVLATDSFDRRRFDNTIIIIGVSKSSVGPYSDQAIFLSSTLHDLNKAIEICSDADLVVLYGLDIVKSYLATKLPQNVNIAWRFFGYELYGREIGYYLSEKSLASYSAKVGSLWDFLSQVRLAAKYRALPNRLFRSAIKRIDLFLCLSKYEYDHLLQRWDGLPVFVQLPLLLSPLPQEAASEKSNTLLIGNSANVDNNHIDIIDIIEHSSISDDFSFLIPFSYGHGKLFSKRWFYSNAVRRRVVKSPKKFRLLESFLPRDAYYELVTSAKGAVFNSYRQMAMGNILALLASGAKVYLSTRNVIYSWLVDLGLNVYTVEQFEADLESKSFELGVTERTANTLALERMRLEFNRNEFSDIIVDFVESRK